MRISFFSLFILHIHGGILPSRIEPESAALTGQVLHSESSSQVAQNLFGV